MLQFYRDVGGLDCFSDSCKKALEKPRMFAGFRLAFVESDKFMTGDPSSFKLVDLLS